MRKISITFFAVLLLSGIASRAWAQTDNTCTSGQQNCDNGGGQQASPFAGDSATGSGDAGEPASHDGYDPGNGGSADQNYNSGEPVNTFSGHAWYTATDFNCRRVGFPLKFERYYESGITSPAGEWGSGWMSNYDVCLYTPDWGKVQNAGQYNDFSVTLVMPHDTYVFTTTDGGYHFTASPGCFYQLQISNRSSYPFPGYQSTYVVTNRKGITYHFQSFYNRGGPGNTANLTEIDDLNGNKVSLTYEEYYTSGLSIDTTMQYKVNVRLTEVTGPNWWIQFSYYGLTDYQMDQSRLRTTFDNSVGQYVQQVTNSVGDTISFALPSVGAYYNASIAGYISTTTYQVTRSPNGLNATYTTFNWIDYVNEPNCNHYGCGYNIYQVTGLQKVVDPLGPKGFRNVTYVWEFDQNYPYVPAANDFAATNAVILDGVGHVQQILNGDGQVAFTYGYSTDSSGDELTTITEPNGLYDTDVYDSTDRMIQKRYQIDSRPVTDFFTWDSNNLLTSFIDGNGNQIIKTYDSLGNITHIQDGKGYTEDFTYNNISRLTQSTDKDGDVHNYQYDSNGNLTEIDEPLGRTTKYTYYSNGLVNTVADPNGHTTTYTYDPNGNLTSIQGPPIGPPENLPGSLTQFNFDGRGHLQYKIDALQQRTTYLYTPNQMWLQDINYPDNTNDHFEYDAVGNMTLHRDKNGTSTKYVYDAADHLTDAYQAYGTSDVRHTSFTYDALGHVLTVTDNKGQQTTYTYNEQNLVKSVSDSLNKGYTNTYDNDKNLLTTTDTRNVTRTMGYDADNRLTGMTFSDGTSPIAFTYDGNGNRISMTDAAGSKTYIYDALNRPTTILDTTRNFDLYYTYDAVGNRLTLQNNIFSGTVSYGYYADNTMKTVADSEGLATTFIYDPMKNIRDEVYPNGVTAVYSYVPTDHRLASLQNLTSNGEILSTYSYGYDGVGNQMAVTDLTGATTYGYDNLYQLTSATYPGPEGTVSYGYDGVGNRTSLTQNNVQQTLGYDTGNEITNGLGESFMYDQVGNMTQRTSSAGTTTYTWDGLNRLVNVGTPNGNIQYVYDGNNLRVRKIGSNGTINYFYDGISVIAETDGNGVLLKKYNPGISMVGKDGVKLFYLKNGHDDVTGLVDTKENLVQDYSYDAFGGTKGTQRDKLGLRYVGSLNVYSDDDTGLEYMWNRWYDQKLGRFISHDPAGLKGELNLYTYADNSPERWGDPWGLQDVDFGTYFGMQTNQYMNTYVSQPFTQMETQAGNVGGTISEYGEPVVATVSMVTGFGDVGEGYEMIRNASTVTEVMVGVYQMAANAFTATVSAMNLGGADISPTLSSASSTVGGTEVVLDLMTGNYIPASVEMSNIAYEITGGCSQ